LTGSGLPTRTVHELSMIDEETPDDENPPWPKRDRAANVRDALFVSDTEIYRRLGVGALTGRIAIQELERLGRFPKKDPLFGNKRYWPAVAKAIDDRYSVSPYRSRTYNAEPDGEETAPQRQASTSADDEVIAALTAGGFRACSIAFDFRFRLDAT
jgi:hypothetical protein